MIRFVPVENGDLFKMIAFEGENQIGECEFTLDGFNMSFVSVSCNDDIITEGLARASLNFAANRNAYISKISRELSSAAFMRLGFSGDDILSAEIPEALTSGCSCSHSNQ